MNRIMIPCLVMLAACGLSGGKELGALDVDDATKLCEESAVEAQSVECDGFTIEIEATNISECATAVDSIPEGCTATVADWRDCFEGVNEPITCPDPDAEPVEPVANPACDRVFAEACQAPMDDM